jgi:hypothetical protein
MKRTILPGGAEGPGPMIGSKSVAPAQRWRPASETGYRQGSDAASRRVIERGAQAATERH